MRPEHFCRRVEPPAGRRNPKKKSSLLYSCAKAMILACNRKCKYQLKWHKLRKKNVGNNEGMDIDTDMGEDEGGDSFEKKAKE